MLEQVEQFNRFTPKFLKELEEKVRSYGPKIRYKFNIGKDNPDPEKYNGKIVYPFLYTLDPVQLRITDPYETREGESKSKLVALVIGQDEKGVPNKFQRIRVYERHKGVFTLNVEEYEELHMAMYLELHPKLKNGLFPAKGVVHIVERIDEHKEAELRRRNRDARAKARSVAVNMDEKAVKQFAAAMMWDETEDIEVLMDRVEALAESDPKVFNDLVESKQVEYQATIRRAMDKEIITWNPLEWKFVWADSSQTIVVLGVGAADKNEVQRFAEWCMTNGIKGDEVFKKISSLVNSNELVVK